MIKFTAGYTHDLCVSRPCVHHGGPSEAGDGSQPPPKMATAENPTSGKGTFDDVIEIVAIFWHASRYWI